MTINQMIRELEKLEKELGTGTKVYFDCPHCLASYSPTRLVSQCIHIKTEQK